MQFRDKSAVKPRQQQSLSVVRRGDQEESGPRSELAAHLQHRLLRQLINSTIFEDTLVCQLASWEMLKTGSFMDKI